MKKTNGLPLLLLLLTNPMPLWADDVPQDNPTSVNSSDAYSQETSPGKAELEGVDVLLTALGGYIGYDLTQTNNGALKYPISTLFDVAGSALLQQLSLITSLGAIPVNAYSEAFAQFVPSGSTYSAINDMSNFTFEGKGGGSSAYNTASTANDGGVTVTALMDQPTYQKDPINQAVLNILATPNYTYCMDNDGLNWLTNPPSDCAYLYNLEVPNNVIGTLPGSSGDQAFFSYAYNESIVPQLNGNTLIAPLLYASAGAVPSGSSNQSTGEKGLAASNQLQEAANFVRYATFAASPITLPKKQDYDAAYATASSTDPKVSTTAKSKAQSDITTYLTGLRTYAAQMSVPIGNLYSILSKRMTQQSGSDSNPTSQALSEFQMATRRLYNPSTLNSNERSNQWINQINAASAATVQKEIAILLAEINYQLYLTRQQGERQLLTNSIMLMQALRTSSVPDFPSANGSAENGASTQASDE